MKGGTIHVVGGFALTHSGSEATATTGVTLLARPADWLDKQIQQVDPLIFLPEGQVDPFTITGGSFTFNIWPTNYAVDVQLLIPYFFWMGVINLFNDLDDGDPVNDSPIALPNLFLRDYGRQGPAEISGILAPQPGPRIPAGRILHREFGLVQADSTSIGANQDVIHRHRFRLKRCRIARNQALCIGYGGYDTHTTTNISLGFQIAGTFGYVHQQRW